MSTTREIAAMRQAIALSALGLGTTSPNPPVGCVILDAAGQVSGQGYHRRKGEAHAEVNALAAAGERAIGGTAVVTLEPCNHHGVTPPCHQALIDAGIRRVVIALVDPTSRGEGGVSRLQQAGLNVEVGCLPDEASLVLGPWLKSLRTRRPHLIWAHLPEAYSGKSNPAIAADLEALRSSVDIVLLPDGTVHETVPGSHLPGVLSLGNFSPGPHAEAVARAMFETGSRRALIEGSASDVASFLRADLVEHVVIYRHVETPSSLGEVVTPMVLFPEGFHLGGLARLRDFLRIDAYR